RCLSATDQRLQFRSVRASHRSGAIPCHESYGRARRPGEALKSRSAIQTTELLGSSLDLWGTSWLSAFFKVARRGGLQAWALLRAGEKCFGNYRSFHLLRADISR